MHFIELAQRSRFTLYYNLPRLPSRQMPKDLVLTQRQTENEGSFHMVQVSEIYLGNCFKALGICPGKRTIFYFPRTRGLGTVTYP